MSRPDAHAGADASAGLGAGASADAGEDGWRGSRQLHEVLVYDDPEQLVRRVVPFLRAAFALDQVAVAILSAGSIALLGERLGSEMDGLAFLADSATWWRGEWEAVHAYRGRCDRSLATGRPWRSVCEPTWMATRSGQGWGRYEAVLNLGLATSSHYALCLYDRRTQPAEVLCTARATHPLASRGTGAVASVDYVPPEPYLRSIEPDWTSRPQMAVTTTVTNVASARVEVRHALGTGWDERGEDIELAVHELVANSVRLAGAAQLSSWVAEGRLVWEVADEGPGLYDVAAGYCPPGRLRDSGRGLWIARCLADESTVRAGGRGTTIRLFFAR